jgi:FixJ family two-component response regulator
MKTKPVVAVVDDDYRVLESLESLLESAGHEVHGFASASALLHSSVWRKLDLLISDIGMTGIDGFALQRRLQDDRPGVPVIFITGSANLLRQSEDESNDALIFFKPFDAARLLRAVDERLGR